MSKVLFDVRGSMFASFSNQHSLFACSIFKPILCLSVSVASYLRCMNKGIADLRKEYASETLLEKDMAQHPVEQFQKWWDQALASEITEPKAMTLATA